MKKIFSIATFVILITGLLAGIYYSTQKTGFELRKKASEISGSQFILKGPSSVKLGEQFSVDIVLDTSTDPKYTVSAADAVVSYSSTSSTSECNGRELVCKAFDSRPDFCLKGTLVYDKPSTPCECAPPPRCVTDKELAEESKQISNEKMIAKMYNFSLLSVIPGKIFDSYPSIPKISERRPMPAETANGISQELNQKPSPDGGPLPETNPQRIANSFTISGIKNYSTTDKGSFNGFSGSGVFATLTFIAGQSGTITVELGYSGQDATNDSNINGFLKDSPVSLQTPVERLLSAPQALTIKIEKEQIIISPATTPPTTTPFPTISCGGFAGIQCPNGMECVYPSENSDSLKKVGMPDQMGTCVTQTTPTKDPMPTSTLIPSPSPTPRPITGTVNAFVEFEGYTRGPLEVSLYGISNRRMTIQRSGELVDPNNRQPIEAIQPVPVLLGKGTTNPDGSVRITVEKEFLGMPYYLFVETPLHLRKYQISNPKPIVMVPDCSGEICTMEIKNEVRFGELVAGDINGDTYGKKDQIINSFDVSVLYTQWSGADETTGSGFSEINNKPAGNGDLNRDGVVNTRDLAIILRNYNKRGETEPISSVPISIWDRYKEGMIEQPTYVTSTRADAPR